MDPIRVNNGNVSKCDKGEARCPKFKVSGFQVTEGITKNIAKKHLQHLNKDKA